ncbi:hypothetical protein [Aliivibrio fischeri]|uniref:hypothetical protein n=1 Tax=Aliivibrio fischeri TaxID=668 RepID=UPI000160C4E0|nr:hypothetical protein [Aliivibrio fischeri]
MTSTKHLIDTFQSRLPNCYKKQAFNIELKLKEGTFYSALGGKKIQSCPTYIRFKLGRGFRFIWHIAPDGFHPKTITTRQGFERIIKQLRNSSY